MITLIRGLPGSGKTTLAKKMVKNRLNTEYVEADMYFIDDSGKYVYDKTRIKAAHIWRFREVRRLVESGKDVVVSNTFVKLQDMEPYRHLAKECGVPIRVIVMTENYGSVHDVPRRVIDRMRKNWEFTKP